MRGSIHPPAKVVKTSLYPARSHHPYLLAIAGVDPGELEALEELEAAFDDEHEWDEPDDYE